MLRRARQPGSHIPPVPSEATIGRWLQRLALGCPICGGRRGEHVPELHALNKDLGEYGLAKPPQLRRARVVRERGTVAEVEKFLRGGQS